MSTPGFIFFVMFVVFISTLGGLALWKLFDIVRNSIKKNKTSGDDERFDRLAKAFIQHRDKTDKRLQNIEAIITHETQHAVPVTDSTTVETDGGGRHGQVQKASTNNRTTKQRTS